MGKRLAINPGDRFGRVTILKETESIKRQRRFDCLCDCGKEWNVALILLTTGQTKSCGCLRKERFITNNTKHGQSKTKLYKVWTSMLQRCNNEKCDVYHHYGGRGICVCDEWKRSFEDFQSWSIANGYKEGLSIERINNNGNYEPSNCKWETPHNQALNRRNTIYIEYQGECKLLFDWAIELGMNYDTFYGRYYNGSLIEDLFQRNKKGAS